jgi:hypothetical protein
LAACSYIKNEGSGPGCLEYRENTYLFIPGNCIFWVQPNKARSPFKLIFKHNLIFNGGIHIPWRVRYGVCYTYRDIYMLLVMGLRRAEPWGEVNIGVFKKKYELDLRNYF